MRSFAHALVITPKQLGRYQIEVFPHPAIIHLCGLERILKCKKGKLAERHIELRKLYQYIVNILPALEPALNLNGKGTRNFILPSSLVSGTALEAFKARLDGLICAYVAAP